MSAQSLILAALLLVTACSRAAPEVIDAGPRPWIMVTPANVSGYGVPPDFVRVVTGKRVEVWADPNDPSLDLKDIIAGAKR